MVTPPPLFFCGRTKMLVHSLSSLCCNRGKMCLFLILIYMELRDLQNHYYSI